MRWNNRSIRKKDDMKEFEKNNVMIALNVLYAIKDKNISCLCFKAQLKL